MRTLLAIALVFASASAGFAQTLTAPVHHLAAAPTAPHIKIDAWRGNLSGDIRVVAWDRAAIQIDVTTDPADAQYVTVDLNQDGNTITIDAHSTLPRRFFGLVDAASVRALVDLHVPRNALLECKTVNGDVGVRDVTGAIGATPVNGNIAIGGSAAVLDVGTVNGKVDAAVAPGHWVPQIEIHTVNGDVTLTFPRGFSTHVSVATVNGDVRDSSPKASGPGSASIKTVNGTIVVQTARNF